MRLFQLYLIAGLAVAACSPQDDTFSVEPELGLATVSDGLGAPTVSVTSPTNGSTVSGWVFLTASATDDVSVSKVEFYLDGNLLGTQPSSPYTIIWFVQDFPNGVHVLTAKAYDTDGNVGISAPISVTVDNDLTAPVVSVTSPTQGTHLAGVVSVTADASDNRGVSGVNFFVDGTSFQYVSSSPFVATWDSHMVGDGAHVLTATAYDAAGNSSTSAPVTVNVAQPGAAVYDPARGAPVCAEGASVCDTGTLVLGRGLWGPELHWPNTVDGCADGMDSSYQTEQIRWLRVSREDGLPFATGRRVRLDVGIEVDSFLYDTVDLYFASDASAPEWTLLASRRVDAMVRGVQVVSAEYVLPAGSVQVVRANYHISGNRPTPCSTGNFDDRDDLVFGVSEVVDEAPPTVSLAAPVNNQQVAGTFTVAVNAEDDLAVTRVEVYDGQTLLGADTTPPFSVAWATQDATAGAHTLTAKAYDAAGHVSTSSAVSVIVDKSPPGVSISAPAADSLIGGTVQLTAGASDDHGIARVDFYEAGYYLGPLIGSATTAPYTVPWNTLTTQNGRRTIQAFAYDLAGNVQASEIIGFTVDNIGPTVAITSPANGASVSLSTTIQASASDTSGVRQVAFYDGSKLIGTTTTAPYSVNWLLLLVPRGQHTLTARATDVVGNVTTSAAVVVTVK